MLNALTDGSRESESIRWWISYSSTDSRLVSTTSTYLFGDLQFARHPQLTTAVHFVTSSSLTMRCCVLLISVCVASAASFKEGDVPTCHVDSAGRTVVKYTDTLQSHKAFKCTHAGNKCTCGAHPTHRDCRQFDHTDASTHTLGGGCQQPIEGCAGKTLSLFNSANTRICACVDASAVNGKCSQYTWYIGGELWWAGTRAHRRTSAIARRAA